jgi:hypothetical protein
VPSRCSSPDPAAGLLDTSLAVVDFQHVIVRVVYHVQQARGVEGDTVRAFQQIALGESGGHAVAADSANGVTPAVGDVQIARRWVDRDTDRASQSARGEQGGVPRPIDLGDEVAVITRLKQVTLMVDGVATS